MVVALGRVPRAPSRWPAPPALRPDLLRRARRALAGLERGLLRIVQDAGAALRLRVAAIPHDSPGADALPRLGLLLDFLTDVLRGVAPVTQPGRTLEQAG